MGLEWYRQPSGLQRVWPNLLLGVAFAVPSPHPHYRVSIIEGVADDQDRIRTFDRLSLKVHEEPREDIW